MPRIDVNKLIDWLNSGLSRTNRASGLSGRGFELCASDLHIQRSNRPVTLPPQVTVHVSSGLNTVESPVSGHPRKAEKESVRRYWSWLLTGMSNYGVCMGVEKNRVL